MRYATEWGCQHLMSARLAKCFPFTFKRRMVFVSQRPPAMPCDSYLKPNGSFDLAKSNCQYCFAGIPYKRKWSKLSYGIPFRRTDGEIENHNCYRNQFDSIDLSAESWICCDSIDVSRSPVGNTFQDSYEIHMGTECFGWAFSVLSTTKQTHIVNQKHINRLSNMPIAHRGAQWKWTNRAIFRFCDLNQKTWIGTYWRHRRQYEELYHTHTRAPDRREATRRNAFILLWQQQIDSLYVFRDRDIVKTTFCQTNTQRIFHHHLIDLKPDYCIYTHTQAVHVRNENYRACSVVVCYCCWMRYSYI